MKGETMVFTKLSDSRTQQDLLTWIWRLGGGEVEPIYKSKNNLDGSVMEGNIGPQFYNH